MKSFFVVPGVVRGSLVESVRQASLLGSVVISCYPDHYRLVRVNKSGDRAILSCKVAIVRVGK
jgi:hypothetical protein